MNVLVTPDSTNDIFSKPPSQFARLITATNGNEGGWLPVEFGAVLRHQLDTRRDPIAAEGDQEDGHSPQRWKSTGASGIGR